MRVLAHNRDAHGGAHLVHLLRQLLPLTHAPRTYLPAGHHALRGGQLEQTQDVLRRALLAQHQGHVVDVAHVVHAQHVLHGHVAERGDLLLRLLHITHALIKHLLQRSGRTADQEVRG